MEFIFYFGEVFTFTSFGLLLLGTIFGLILGATPGLSPTMAVALAIPFTFKLEPAQGLILLGALYTSTVAGGAVSAILLKIPGAPANIATTLDGHTLAKKGEGARALQVSFLASLFGGVIGVLLLIFLTPVLASWALAFGPSESFWVAILGVTIIGTLGGGSVVKGLLAGCIGLWLSTIGFDDILGTQRFIFHSSLSGGINIIAALIGLFAIPQVISMFAKGRQAQDMEVIDVKPHPLVASIRETIGSIRALGIGTTVGSIIGLIPGVGGQIAGLVAYDQSKNFSPDREKFGTGHPEGIIAAESANNAMVGPSLVPLLTLSIPGSPTAAVLLGGLIIHGIFPGPNIFRRLPRGRLAIHQLHAHRPNPDVYLWPDDRRLRRPHRPRAFAHYGRYRARARRIRQLFGANLHERCLRDDDPRRRYVFSRTLRLLRRTPCAWPDPWPHRRRQLC